MNKEVDKGSIAIKVIAISLVLIAIIGVVLLVVFNKPKPREDFGVEYAGKYVLTQISGLNDKNGKPIKPSDYEKNEILLKDDGYFEIVNKIYGKETSETGVWYVENGQIFFEVSKMLGLMKYTDKGVISNNKITMTLEGKDSTVVMVLTRS